MKLKNLNSLKISDEAYKLLLDSIAFGRTIHPRGQKLSIVKWAEYLIGAGARSLGVRGKDENA